MYKFKREKQISFTDFNQPLGMQMNPDNRWVKKAAMVEENRRRISSRMSGISRKPPGILVH